MKKLLICLLFAALGLAVPAPIAIAQDADTSETETPDEHFVIETRHRLFPQFVQIDTVIMNQPFYIGEEEYEARVIEFNPHLGITTKGEYLRMSDTLYNPAVRVQATLGDIEQESWGFYVIAAPHFKRDDLLAFKLVEFKVGDEYIEAPARK